MDPPREDRRSSRLLFRHEHAHRAASHTAWATSGAVISLCAPETPPPPRMYWLLSMLKNRPSPHGYVFVTGSILTASGSTPAPCAPCMPTPPYLGNVPGAKLTSPRRAAPRGYNQRTALSLRDCVVMTGPETRLPATIG